MEQLSPQIFPAVDCCFPFFLLGPCGVFFVSLEGSFPFPFDFCTVFGVFATFAFRGGKFAQRYSEEIPSKRTKSRGRNMADIAVLPICCRPSDCVEVINVTKLALPLFRIWDWPWAWGLIAAWRPRWLRGRLVA